MAYGAASGTMGDVCVWGGGVCYYIYGPACIDA